MYIDQIVNLFFTELGGLDFMGLFFGSLIIFSVFYSLIKPVDL